MSLHVPACDDMHIHTCHDAYTLLCNNDQQDHTAVGLACPAEHAYIRTCLQLPEAEPVTFCGASVHVAIAVRVDTWTQSDSFFSLTRSSQPNEKQTQQKILGQMSCLCPMSRNRIRAVFHGHGETNKHITLRAFLNMVHREGQKFIPGESRAQSLSVTFHLHS